MPDKKFKPRKKEPARPKPNLTEKASSINMGSPLFKKMLTPVSPFNKSRCWTGYEPVPGKKPYSKGSCRKK